MSPLYTLSGERLLGDLTLRQDLLAEVCRLVASRYDLPETFERLLPHLRSALHVDLLTLALPDEQKNAMRLHYSQASDSVRAELPVELPLHDSPAGMAWLTREIVVVNDEDSEQRWPMVMNGLRAAAIKAYCCVPLTAGDRRIGALGFGSREQNAFGDSDLQLLRQVAIPVAMAVERELTPLDNAVEVTGRKRAEEALHESENRFRVLFDHAADAFCVFDEQYRIIDANREACESVGYTREEVIGRVPQDFNPEVDAAMLQRIDERIEAGETCTFETRHRRKDGTVFPVEVRFRPFWLDGRRLHLAVARDISERKRVEEERRQSAERFRAIADYTYDWENWIGVDGKLLWVNPAVERITGYSVDECMAMPDFPICIVAGADREVVAKQMKEAVQGSSRNDFEFRVRRKDGLLAWVAGSWQPIYDAQGARLGYRSSMRDIAERKRAEDQLRTSQAQLAHERDRLGLLLEINNHVVKQLDAAQLFQAVAASMRKHFGNDLTSLWLVDKQTGSLERKYLDFPTGRGFVEKTPILMPGNFDREILRRRTPQIYSGDFAGLPAATREAFGAEAIVSLVLVPLVGADGALGVLAMCSRQANAFRESDIDLLSQVGTQISLVLDNALAYERLRASHDDLQDQRLYLESEIRAEYNFEEMIGDSAVWRRVLHQITTVAPTDAGVLLLGETGTGKELIARAIHNRSQRRERTLVKLSCAAVPMGLLESELFGHEKGAFTGALTKQVGRFELANRGSLFLDEVGDIPLELQTKLLRALQEQEFERLGNPHTITVDVRVIAATNRDLSQMVKDRTFRQDLYYRLNIFPIVVPPLRERSGDIELLVRHFVAKYAARLRKPIESIPAATMKVLRHYHWPGNVRELEHFIERAVILSPADVLQVPVEELLTGTVAVSIPTLEEGEREQILQALRACGGVIGGSNGAAARLAINRSTLNSRMRKLGITRASI